MKHDKSFKWRSSHAIHRLTYHIVFIPKYRKHILRGKVCQRLSELVYECCIANKWFLHEFQILDDHVHIMLQIPPNISVSKTVMYLKGGTSRIIRQEFPELKVFLWGDSLWQDGYFAETSGKIDEKKLRAYIQKQWEQENHKQAPPL